MTVLTKCGIVAALMAVAVPAAAETTEELKARIAVLERENANLNKQLNLRRTNTAPAQTARRPAAVGSMPAAVVSPTAQAHAAAPAFVGSWTGFYIGGNFGVTAGKNATDSTQLHRPGPGVSVLTTETFNLSPQGGLAGLQAGYNRQIGRHLMAGAEVDFQWTNATVKNCVLGCVPPQIALLYNQRLDYFGTLRGRLGWADGPLLLYLTGGAAYGQIETSVVNIPSGPLTDVREGKWGWTAGGGLESQVSGNVTAKLEYLYLDLGRTSGQGSVDFGGGSIDTYSFSSRLHDHVFRAGMNYKFGEPVQVASLNAMGLSPVPATNWAGFYFGGNAGVSLARNPTNFVGFVPATNITEENTSVTSNPVGATMGGQAGYLARIAPDWLVGIEADLQSAHLNDATTCFVNCAPSQGTRPFIPSIAIHSVTEREDWFATFRGRAGWANGSTLYYLTGGAALARVEADVNFLSALLAPTYVAGANGGGIIAATKWGWVAGGGMETALMSNWSMKAEYLYMDLGSMSGTVLKNGGNEVFTVSSSLRNHLFRLGLNYHLGWNDVIGLN